MAFKFQILRNELDSDPLTRGYVAMSDREVADSLNAEDRTRSRSVVPSWEVLAAIRPVHYQALNNQAHLRYLSLLFSVSDVPLGNPNIRAALATIFNGDTATLSDLVALQDESLSRASELSLGRVSEGHVIHARLL